MWFFKRKPEKVKKSWIEVRPDIENTKKKDYEEAVIQDDEFEDGREYEKIDYRKYI